MIRIKTMSVWTLSQPKHSSCITLFFIVLHLNYFYSLISSSMITYNVKIKDYYLKKMTRQMHHLCLQIAQWKDPKHSGTSVLSSGLRRQKQENHLNSWIQARISKSKNKTRIRNTWTNLLWENTTIAMVLY